ncbi:MAG: TRAP transporter substrate-binding protein [Alphaproteobacteria bacterium]|nr:TRAP transporter substrate-binding protein [Alphaproteobacteria bacterium]
MNTRLFGAIALGAAIAIATPVSAQQIVMKIGTATVGTGDQNMWMERFKQRVEQRAGGRMAVNLFPGSQLGDNTRMMEGTQLGTLEAYVAPTVYLSIADRRFMVLDSPGIFDDIEHGQRVVTDPGFRDMFLVLGTAKNVIGISMWASGTYCLMMRSKPVRTVDDFKGLKIRVLASRVESETARRLGSTGVPMALGEVMQAVQTGVIDGAKGALVVADAFKMWTLTKYLTETDEAVLVSAVAVHKPWFDKLPADLRTAVLEEGKRLDQEMHDYSIEQRKGFRVNWVKNGGELIQLAPAERKKLTERLATVGETVIQDFPEVKPVFQSMLDFAKKHRKPAS